MNRKKLYCGTVTGKFIYPILTCFSYSFLYIVNYIISSFDAKRKDKGETFYGVHSLVNCHFMFIAESASLFFYCISRSLSKGENTIQNENRSLISNIKLIGLIVIPPIFDLSSFINSGLLFSSSNLYNTLSICFFIVISVILSMFFLNTKFYRHHAIGLGIIILGLLIHSIVDNKYSGKMNLFYYLIGIILNQVLFSLQNIFKSM